MDDTDLREAMEGIIRLIYGRQHPAVNFEEYADWLNPDLIAKLIVTSRELESLRLCTVAGRIFSANLIAFTPHQFISKFRSRRGGGGEKTTAARSWTWTGSS